MDAVARMNSLEGVGETASSPQFHRARLKEPLDNDQEKTELISPEDALVSSNFGQTSTRSRDILSSTTRVKCSLGPRSGTCSVRRVGEEPRVTQLVNSPREVQEPLLFEIRLPREVKAPLFFQAPPPGPP